MTTRPAVPYLRKRSHHSPPPYRAKRSHHAAPAYKFPPRLVTKPVYRTIRFTRMVLEYGYAEKTRVNYQAIQRRVSNPLEWVMNGFSMWKTIETEVIPNWAIFQDSCLGFTEWKSPLLAKYAAELKP